MTQTQSTPSASLQIDRPTCSKCGTLMWIARISPIDERTEERTFECPVCDACKIFAVETK